MALVSMRQLLDHAAENGYGLPAFNVNNLEQVRAIMEAADECNSPVIMQGSAGARKYAGEAFLRHGQREAIRLEEVFGPERAPVLKEYLRLAPGARPFIPVPLDAPEEEFATVADSYPVFRVVGV